MFLTMFKPREVGSFIQGNAFPVFFSLAVNGILSPVAITSGEARIRQRVREEVSHRDYSKSHIIL